CETHLPNAFFLFAFVPYFSANAAREASSSPRSASHSLAAFLNSVASCWSSASASFSLALAFWETHLPNAFFLLPFVPYFSWNAVREASSVPRSARHSCDAFL